MTKDLQKTWGSITNENLFIYVNFKQNKILLSDIKNEDNDNILFANHPNSYTRNQIIDIANNFHLYDIEFPNKEIIKLNSHFSKKTYEEQISEYNNYSLKRYIFLIKRTMQARFLADLKKETGLVLAYFDGIKLKIFRCEFAIGDRREIFIPVFSDTDEYELFKKSNEFELVDHKYSLLAMQIKDIIKNINKKEGLYFNPKSIPVSHKDFALALTYDFLKKY